MWHHGKPSLLKPRQIELIYLALANVTLSKSRVAERVAHGGHNIPLADIERRFPRSCTIYCMFMGVSSAGHAASTILVPHPS